MVTAPVRLGVLGCADVALRRMLPALRDVPSVRPVAIASRDGDRARSVAGRYGCAAVEGYEALLDRPDVDAVYLPLPTGLHAEWTARALRAGKHVLAEKPLTTTCSEASALVALARSRGLVLMENTLFLHHSQHRTVRDLISRGTIGEPRVFSGAFGFPPRPPTDIRYRPELGGGALLDAGGYPLRAASYFLGPDLTVVGACLRTEPDRGVDVAGSALLATPEAATADISFGFDHGYRSTYAVWGSAGRIVVDRAFTPPETWRPVVRVERQDHVEELTLPADHQFANAARAFARAVTEPRNAELSETFGESILRQAALIDAIRSAARGRQG
jgi:dTDP-3,4-didehydro-2,6-dideoxy-alpha-D-glucose 3-reductase